MTFSSFSHLGDVSVYYDRRSKDDYGKGVSKTFRSKEYIENKLDKCFLELWEVCPLGKPTKIFTAGAYVPGNPGMHGQGRAFDLDGLEWPNRKFMTLTDGPKNGDRKFYFGVEAILRKHFGLVLDYLYNEPHWCHFHIDDSAPVNFSQIRSKILFLQGALVYVFGLSVGPSGIDGRWGTNTQKSLNEALRQLGISGSINNLEVWKQFLTGTAKEAFGAKIDSRNIEVDYPKAGDKLSLHKPVAFTGTADLEVKTVKLVAEDRYHLDEFSTTGENWQASYKFNQGGERTVFVKGFDENHRQVAQTTINITLRVEGPEDYVPPEDSPESLLPLVANLTNPENAKQITQAFQGSNAIFKFSTGELYIDSNLYINVNGSPNANLLDPLRGSLETSLEYPSQAGQSRFVNSEQVPYFSLPEDLYKPLGIQLGDIGVFFIGSYIAYAVFADVGVPFKALGVSIALAKVLGRDFMIDDLINEGISDRVVCIVFPKSGDGTPQVADDIANKGKSFFEGLAVNSP